MENLLAPIQLPKAHFIMVQKPKHPHAYRADIKTQLKEECLRSSAVVLPDIYGAKVKTDTARQAANTSIRTFFII